MGEGGYVDMVWLPTYANCLSTFGVTRYCLCVHHVGKSDLAEPACCRGKWHKL